jgi:hypothetical protein
MMVITPKHVAAVLMEIVILLLNQLCISWWYNFNNIKMYGKTVEMNVMGLRHGFDFSDWSGSDWDLWPINPNWELFSELWIALFYVLFVSIVLFYALFVSIVLFSVLFVSIVLFYILFVSIVLFYVLFVCKCVLHYWHLVSAIAVNISHYYRIISQGKLHGLKSNVILGTPGNYPHLLRVTFQISPAVEVWGHQNGPH